MATTPSRCYYWLSGDSVNVNLFKRFIQATRKQPTFTTLYYDDLFKAHDESHCSSCDLGSIYNTGKEQKIIQNSKSQHLITANEYLKIMVNKCSLPDVLTKEERNIPNQRRSETYLNTSTTFRTKHIVNTFLIPKKIPSKCLPVLKHPCTQAQLRIYGTQYGTKEKGICHPCYSNAMFEIIKSMQDCHKKDNTKVKKSERFLADDPRVNKIGKSLKLPISVGHCDKLSPFAGHTKAKIKDTIGLQAVKTNSLKKNAQPVNISPDELYNYNLLSRDKRMPERKCHKVKKAAGLPSELSAIIDKQKQQRQKVVTQNRIVRTVPIGTTVPGRETAMKLENLEKTLTKKNKQAKSTSLAQRYTFGSVRKPKEDGSLASLKVNISSKKGKETSGILDYGNKKYITSSEKSPKPKLIQPHNLVHSRIPPTEGNTASEIKHVSKIKQDRCPQIVKRKGKYTATGYIKPLQSKTTPNECKCFRDLIIQDTGLSKGRMESKKARLGTVKSEITSSIPPVVNLPMRQDLKRSRKAVYYVQSSTDKLKDQKENNDNVAVRNTEPQVSFINKIRENKCLPEPFSLTAKEKRIKHNICSIRKVKPTPRKESVNTQVYQTMSPNNRLIKQKYPNIRNAAEPIPLDLPHDRILIEEQPNEVMEEYDKCQSLSTPLANTIRASERKLLKLDPLETVTLLPAFKVKNDILKEILPKDNLPKSKRIASHNKNSIKTNVVLQNILEPEDIFLGDSMIPNDRKSQMKVVENVNVNTTESITYAEFLKLEAARQYAPYIDTEYMISAQKSVLRVLTTYLANIEADLISEFEYNGDLLSK